MATRNPASKNAKAKKPAVKRASAKKTAANKPVRGSSAEEQRAHNPEVARSTRALATTSQEQRPLTEKEALFVAEYLIDLNATQAYLRSHPGVKATSARTEGSRLLANPCIQAAIAQARERTMGKLELTRERILLEATRIALFDPRKMFDAQGNPLAVTELDDDTIAAIAGLDVLEEWDGAGEGRVLRGYVKKYKVADKNGALDKLMKHLGLYQKDNEQKADPLRELLKAIGARSALPVVASPKDGDA